MPMYADVIVNIASLDKDFQYRIPDSLRDQIAVGSAVKIPFGNGMREGYVIGLSDTPSIEVERIREIDSLSGKKMPAESRLIRVAAWMKQTYGSTMQQALTAVLPVRERTRFRGTAEDPSEDPVSGGSEMPLSEEQEDVLAGILKEWETFDRPVLLQGVTGSGKTRVYMELASRVLSEGKQVILLIPEIALSWQMVRRFRRRFGDDVTVMNSRMSHGERTRQFERMKSGEAKLVIGPRSALFAPFPHTGLIVIDEEQEPAYRSETMPRYDCREAALFRAKEEGAHLVLGSATPSLDSCWRARRGEYALLKLEKRFGRAELPDVRIVDMKAESRIGNMSIISTELESAMRECLERKEQAMLFLNRRGVSSVHTCHSCGHVVTCRHCNVSLTLHRDGMMVCHYCGYRIPQPKVCPSCGSPHIRGFRCGTEKVERDAARLFPDARILRMDADTTRHKRDYSELLGRFSRHEADILIGTQMIVKGHDFPDVTLVGVLAADLSLFASDYRSQERTFQLLVQAVGRSGRGDRPGKAVIQTFHPEHECITRAVQQDYEAFYEDEIAVRELGGYPPAEQMLAIHASSADEAQLQRAMEALKNFLLRLLPPERVIGPAPEPVSRKKDVFYVVLYVRGASGTADPMKEMIRLRLLAEKYIAINSGFNKIRFTYELNP
mgnify:CR=1 FL=1